MVAVRSNGSSSRLATVMRLLVVVAGGCLAWWLADMAVTDALARERLTNAAAGYPDWRVHDLAQVALTAFAAVVFFAVGCLCSGCVKSFWQQQRSNGGIADGQAV